MPFLPTEQQHEFQRGVRDVLAAAWPLEALTDSLASTEAWEALVEAGLFELRTELDASWADAAGVFVELGRALVPGPVVATFVTRGLLPDEQPTTVVDPAHAPLLVPDIDVARWVLVLGDGPAEVVALAEASPVAVTDPVDPFTTVGALPDRPTGKALAADSGELRRQGMLLTAAYQVGIAERVTQLAVDYAKTREQFGRPIGGFQAVKHICADMFARTELARVAVEAAAVTLDDPEVGDVVRATAGAKLLADEAASTNGRSSIQVHGGMGFTWEVPVHFFLRRAWRLAAEWATPDEAADLVAQSL